MKTYQKQLNKEILKKELFRFLKEKGVDKKSGISILQAYKNSISLWFHKRQECGNITITSPILYFDFALSRAINNGVTDNRTGCDIINFSFDWSTSRREYGLDEHLWATLDNEWNEKARLRWYR